MKSKHSSKTMTTITRMETTPEQWGVAPYTVRTELRDMHLKVSCSGCSQYGTRDTYYMLNEEYTQRTELLCRYEEDGIMYNNYTTEQVQEAYAKYTYNEAEVLDYLGVDVEEMITAYGRLEIKNGQRTLAKAKRDIAWELTHNTYRYHKGASAVAFRTLFTKASLPCPDCANGQYKHNRYTWLTLPRSTGYVTKFFKDVKVNAHYPAWPQGTTFPSKYDGCDCEACGKTIRKSGTYAVVAKRDDGTSVGMFVGNACIKKFGFKAYKTVDAQAETWAKKVTSTGGATASKDIVVDIYCRSKKTFEGVDVSTVDDLS